jgi:hypothetical protein
MSQIDQIPSLLSVVKCPNAKTYGANTGTTTGCLTLLEPAAGRCVGQPVMTPPAGCVVASPRRAKHGGSGPFQ